MGTSTQRQFLIKVDGVDDYFATKTGGAVEGERTTAWNGGRKKPERLGGPPVPGELTVSRPYDVDRDYPMLKGLRPKVNKWYTTVTIQPTDPDGIALDVDPTVYTDCLLVRATDPDVDAGSANPATCELVFDPGDVA